MKNQIIVTPKGELAYPHLSKPDTKFDKDGVYRTVLKTEYNDEAKAFARKIRRTSR